jgi:hypothetical protein
MYRALRLHSAIPAITWLGVVIGGCTGQETPACGAMGGGTSVPCSTGGMAAMGGSNATGGSATGGTATGGSATGGTATGGSPPDLTCNTDDDCCVAVDTCAAQAAVYSKLTGPWKTWPGPSSGCSKCWAPTVDVRCQGNWCQGQASTSPSMQHGPAHCGRLTSGTGGTTGTAGASGGSSGQSTSTSAASPETEPLLGDSALPIFGCG